MATSSSRKSMPMCPGRANGSTISQRTAQSVSHRGRPSGEGGTARLRDQLELAQDVPMRHAREEDAADQVGHAVLGHERLERADDLVGGPGGGGGFSQRV